MATRPSRFFSVLSWIWFPICLIALFFLALPGVVFLFIYLVSNSWYAATNIWLQKNFNLSYRPSLIVPGIPWLGPALLVLVLLLPLVILLLYFLKLKRRPLQVPSTFLWKKSIEDLHVNSLLQWLRRNVLLLLQILLLLVLLYSLLGFRTYANITGNRHYILMIDNSASMSTRDKDGMTRLQWAKQAALNEIDAAADSDHGMVIVFNTKATTLQTYTNNRVKLRDAVRSIQQTERSTRILEALTLADRPANPRQAIEDVASRPANELPDQEREYVPPKGVETDVYLFSDGRFPDLTPADLAQLNSKQAGNTSALGNIHMQFHSAGKRGADNVNNVGIVAFNAVRLLDEDGKEGDPDILNLQALVRVRNYRPQPATDLKLVLDVELNGRLDQPFVAELDQLNKRVVETKENSDEVVKEEPGEQEVTFKLPPLNINDNPVLKAYLPGLQDDFQLDNQAWLAFGRQRKAKVLIVGATNPILKAFFYQKATRKRADFDWIEPSELDKEKYRKIAGSGEIDLVIFDRCTPKKVSDMPQANTFFIGRPPPPWTVGNKKLKYPLLMVSKRNHPILKQLTTLWDLRIVSSWRFHPLDNLPGKKIRDQYTTDPSERSKTLLPKATRLIEAPGDEPVIFTMRRNAYTDLVMTFSLLSDDGDLISNWPLQPSFPLFMRNVLYELGNVNDSIRSETVQPGQTMKLYPQAGVHKLTVTSPSGVRQEIERSAQPYFSYATTDKTGIYNVRLDDGSDRQFTVNLVDANESNIEPRESIEFGDEVIAAGTPREQPFDIWKWMVLGAVGLLLVEWYVYNRRVYI